jgi:hypothetical protein
MAKPIFNTVAGIFGRRSTGKTLYLKGSEEFNLPSIFTAYLNKKMKVLIIDTIDHPSYRDIPVIKPEQLHKWKAGVYRLWVRPKEMPELVQHINKLNSMWNTLIVFEDAYKHLKGQFYDGMAEIIIDSKQKNIDIVFMYHAFGWAPKDLFRVLDFIEVFKTNDSPESRREDMPGYYEAAMKVYTEVKNNKSNYYHKLIDTGL